MKFHIFPKCFDMFSCVGAPKLGAATSFPFGTKILARGLFTTRKRAIDGIDTNGAPDKRYAISIY